MEDGVTNNQTPAANAGADDIGSIMGGMQQPAKPANEPANGGDKGQGNGNGSGGNDNGNDQLPAWTSQIGDVLKNDGAKEKFSKFEKLSDLAKSYLELEAKTGNSIAKPGENASDDEREAFYRALGKPETADKYSVKGDDVAAFREMAFKANLTDEQAQKLFVSMQELGKNTQAQMQANFDQQAKQTQADLAAEYGDKYPEKIEMLKRGIKAYGGDVVGAKLQKAGLLADKDIVKLFINLGEQAAEAGTPTKTSGKPDGYKSITDGGHLSFGDDFKDKK